MTSVRVSFLYTFLLVLAFFCSFSFGYDYIHIAPTGLDTPTCGPLASPCRTFKYSMDQFDKMEACVDNPGDPMCEVGITDDWQAERVFKFLSGEYLMDSIIGEESSSAKKFTIAQRSEDEVFSLESVDGALSTTIKCEGSKYSPISISYGLLLDANQPLPHMHIQGFKIQGCHIQLNLANVTLRDVVVMDGKDISGTIQIIDSHVEIEDSHILNNVAHSTRSIAAGIDASISTLVIRDTAFRNNSGTAHGGAIHLTRCPSVVLSGVTAEDNVSPKGGGFIYAIDTKISADNCEFSNNVVVESDGVGSVFGLMSSELDCDKCHFAENIGPKATGIHVSDGVVALRNSVIDEYGASFLTSTKSSVIMQNTTAANEFYLTNSDFDATDSRFANINLRQLDSNFTVTGTELNSTTAIFKNGHVKLDTVKLGINTSLKVEYSAVEMIDITMDGCETCVSLLHCKANMSHIEAVNSVSPLHLVRSDIDMNDALFEGNEGVLGGAIYDEYNEFSTFDGVVCKNNRARAGGCIYTMNPAELPQFTEANGNTVLDGGYGPFRAGPSAKLGVVQLNVSSDSADVDVGLYDGFDQLVTYHKDTKISLQPASNILAVRGNLTVDVATGVAAFLNLELLAPPGNYTLFASSPPLTAVQFPIELSSCPPGSGFDGQQCVECLAGTYSDVPTPGPCKACPDGTWTYSQGSLSCSNCPIGTYSSASGCVPCPSNHYTEEDGQSVCIACPPLMVSSHLRDGCVCKGGMYPSTDSDGNLLCVRCPEGLMCFGSNSSCIRNGYYRAENGEVYRCQHEGCRGTCREVLSGNPDPEEETHGCREGHGGFSCTECLEDRFMLEPYCETCFSSGVSMGLFFIVIGMWLLVFLIVLMDVSTEMQAFGGYKSLIRWMQALSSILTACAFNFPSVLRWFLFFVSFFSLDPLSFPCSPLTTFSFNFKFWFSFFLIPGTAFVLFILYTIVKVSKGSSLSMRKKFIQFFAVLFTLFFAPTVYGVSRLFACTPSAEGAFLTFAPEKICYDFTWTVQAICVAVYGMIWVGIAVPAVFKEHKNPGEFLQGLTACFRQLLPSYEVIEEIWLIFICGVLVAVARSTAFQAATGMVSCFAVISIHVQKWPYAKAYQNKMQVLYYISCLLLFIAGLTLRLGLTTEENSGIWAGGIMAINALLAIIGLVLVVKHWFKKRFTSNKAANLSLGLVPNKLKNPLATIRSTHNPLRMRGSTSSRSSSDGLSDFTF
ncbi:hypothetical protein PCE1_002890 [Barthelona sp. PCE]